MLKVEQIQLPRMHNEEHYLLMKDTMGLIATTTTAVHTVLSGEMNGFADIVKREDAALEHIRKSMITGEIKEVDELRDNLYHAIYLKVKAYSYSHLVSEYNAAAELQVVIDHYGDFRRKSYNEQTATVSNFVQDMRARQQAMGVLGLNDWITQLNMMNDSVHALMDARFNQEAAVHMENVAGVRKEADVVFHRMAELMDAAVLLHGATDYQQFVDRWNEHIRYYKTTLAHRAATLRTAAEKKREKE